MTAEKQQIIAQLKKQLLEVQGFKPQPLGLSKGFGLGPIERCFPHGIFPTGTIHEFIAEKQEDVASSEGFIAALLAIMMETGNACLWISYNRKLFPPAMQTFGVDPQQIIFIDLYYKKEILWTMEEALKCEGIACVVAELPDIDFAQSRRLQLATENSHVTGILLRKQPKRSLTATACTVRWQVISQPSINIEGMPGVGHPRWEVNLLKVRNGLTGRFHLEWAESHLVPYEENKDFRIETAKKVG